MMATSQLGLKWIEGLASLLLWTLAVPLVRAYPSGAGNQACPTESPQVCHGSSPQANDSPYSLLLEVNTYSPGVPINVTLQSSGNTSFLGFLCGAHSSSASSESYLGTFADSAEVKSVCADNSGSGVTHTNDTDKTNLTLTWTPPEDGSGNIVFSCAFVEEYKVYWVNVTSSSLSPSGFPNVTDVTTAVHTTPTTAPSSDTFTKDGECGKSKSCYGDCGSNGCSFLTTWHKIDQSLAISIQSLLTSGDNMWMAIGFGTKAKMFPASVSECVLNQEVRAFMSFNHGPDNKRVTPNASIGLSDVQGSVVDGVFTCSFLRGLQIAGAGPDVYNLTTNYHIMLARGKANGWDKIPHDEKNDYVTSESYDVTTVVDIGASLPSHVLVKLHGCVMTLAWILSGSLGILVARFYKGTWPANTLCGLKVWFSIHRVAMSTTFLLTAAGFVLIFIHVAGYSQLSGPTYHKAHPVLGIIVTALTVINPIMSLFRCGPNHVHRPLFNWAHWFVGSCAYILGVIAVGIGLRLSGSDVPDYTVYLVAGFAGWHVIAHLLLELAAHSEARAPIAVTGVYKDLQSSIKTHHATVKYHRQRQAIFFIHICIAMAISIAIMVIVIGA